MDFIVHTYLTNGFVEMAKVFLKSLYFVHKKTPIFVWLDTRGCNENDIRGLKQCYPDSMLYINNMQLPLEEWSKKAGLSVDLMKKYKNECEQIYINKDNKVWKLMTAGDDRVKRLYDILWPSEEFLGKHGHIPNFNYIAHFDIDTLFRKRFSEVIKYMMRNIDIWLKLRPNSKVVKARITIDCIFVKPTKNIQDFFNKWIYHIDRVSPIERPVGWGQASCWHAFEEFKDKINYAKLPLEFGLPSRNDEDDYIWTGNIHNLRKDDCVKMFEMELDRCKK